MNLTILSIPPKPALQRRRIMPRVSLKAVLAGLLFAVVIVNPVLAQTIKTVDDGTVLKQIIIFGRHSIRASVTDTNKLGKFAANPYPNFDGVPAGYLTMHGQQASVLLGSYFRQYLLHEGLLTGDVNADVARSYFRANTIQRSYMTAAQFGAGLIPQATIPIHTYATNTPDPVFDPILASVATVDPDRALTEVLGVFGSGATLASAYSGELSLISKVLYPPGTQPTNGAAHGSIDPTTLPFFLTNTQPPYFTGGVISSGGLNTTMSAADPFVMQYVDGFAANDVGWGRLTLDTLSQQTRLITLQIDIAMRQPYLAKVQSSSAASHVLRSMNQAVTGEALPGAFGTPQSQVQVIISSDYYVCGLAGLLGLHWSLPGYQADYSTPGGALIFELRQVKATQAYLVRVFFTAQTFDQLRNLTTLDQDTPPATMQLLIPGGGNEPKNLDVSFITFSNLLTRAIGLEYVQPFDQETPPGVSNPYAAPKATNLTVSVIGNTLKIAWPSDHLGWILQAQTNGLTSGQWVDLPGTGVASSMDIPVNLTNSSVFYRQYRP